MNVHICKLIDDERYSYQYLDIDGDCTRCSADNMIDVFYEQGFRVVFKIMLFPTTSTDHFSNGTTNDDADEDANDDTDVDVDEAAVVDTDDDGDVYTDDDSKFVSSSASSSVVPFEK